VLQTFPTDKDAVEDFLKVINPGTWEQMSDAEKENWRRLATDFLSKYLSCFGLSLREIRYFHQALRRVYLDPNFGKCIEDAMSFENEDEFSRKLLLETLLYEYASIVERETYAVEKGDLVFYPPPLHVFYYYVYAMTNLTDWAFDENMQPIMYGIYARMKYIDTLVDRSLLQLNLIQDENMKAVFELVSEGNACITYWLFGLLPPQNTPACIDQMIEKAIKKCTESPTCRTKVAQMLSSSR